MFLHNINFRLKISSKFRLCRNIQNSGYPLSFWRCSVFTLTYCISVKRQQKLYKTKWGNCCFFMVLSVFSLIFRKKQWFKSWNQPVLLLKGSQLMHSMMTWGNSRIVFQKIFSFNVVPSFSGQLKLNTFFLTCYCMLMFSHFNFILQFHRNFFSDKAWPVDHKLLTSGSSCHTFFFLILKYISENVL